VYSVLHSEIPLFRKPPRIGHKYIYTFLLRMTDTMTSQNIDLPSWDTCITAYRELSELNNSVIWFNSGITGLVGWLEGSLVS
jgi:hypothetical protein